MKRARDRQPARARLRLRAEQPFDRLQQVGEKVDVDQVGEAAQPLEHGRQQRRRGGVELEHAEVGRQHRVEHGGGEALDLYMTHIYIYVYVYIYIYIYIYI